MDAIQSACNKYNISGPGEQNRTEPLASTSVAERTSYG